MDIEQLFLYYGIPILNSNRNGVIRNHVGPSISHTGGNEVSSLSPVGTSKQAPTYDNILHNEVVQSKT